MASVHSSVDGGNTISFAHRLAGSPRFKALFRDGMDLVEEVAAYLDGPGREEAKNLPRPVAIAYAAESMRLTTRLMQVASWLLVQRAVNEGDMDPAQAEAEKHKVRLCAQDVASGPGVFAPAAAPAAGADGPLAAPAEPHHLPRPHDPPPRRGRPRRSGRRASEFDLQRERIRQAFHAR